MRGSSVSIKLNVSKLKRTLNSIQNLKTKNEISKELEISRQALSNYQTGKSLPSEETFERLISFFNSIKSNILKEDLVDPVKLLEQKQDLSKENSTENLDQINLKGFRNEVNEKLKELNFTSQWFNHLPWNGVSINEKSSGKRILFFTGVGEKEQVENLLERISSTQKVVKLFNNSSIWIIQDEKIIPDLQDSITTTKSNLQILSFHELTNLKKKQNHVTKN